MAEDHLTPIEPDAPDGRGPDGARMEGSPFFGLFLSQRNDLSQTQLDALARVPVERRIFSDGETIVEMGPTRGRSCLLVRGAALRRHPAGAGPSGVSALSLPGDFMDLHAYRLDDLDHEMGAIGRAVVEFVEHAALDRLIEAHPEVGKALWRETLLDAKINRAWVIAGSNLQASQRIAHLLCEMEVRLGRIGLSEAGHFDSPLDQKRVAETLGLSAVHVNRAVQELRATHLLAWKGRSVHLPDIEGIRAFANFDPSYLRG